MSGSRKKTGCLNCRKRHKKCDELRPRCTLCTKKNEECQWPLLRGRFHQHSHTTIDSKVFKPTTPTQVDTTLKLKVYSGRLIESLKKMKKNSTDTNGSGPIRRNESTESFTQLMNNTMSPGSELWHDGSLPTVKPALSSQAIFTPIMERKDIAKGETYSGSAITKFGLDHILNPHENSKTLEPDLAEPTQKIDTGGETDEIMEPFMLYSDLHSTLRDYMFTNAAVADMDFDATSNHFKNSPLTVFNLEHLDEFKRPESTENFQEMGERLKTFVREGNEGTIGDAQLGESQKLQLYQNYLYEIAPWLDMFDITRVFGTRIPQLAKSSNALLNAIYAISSRQIELTTPDYNKDITLKLYQASLKELIPPVTKKIDTAMVTSCVLLCVLEMMSSSPNDWRYHLEGCAALFKANDIHGFSAQMERGLFWCYARMDICAAVISEKSTIINSEDWLPKNVTIEMLREHFLKSDCADMYANYMVFLCSRVLNLISNDNENSQYSQDWEKLWEELIRWHAECPEELRPFAECEDTPFPGILYLAGPAVSSNQLYHMAIILMIENKPRRYKIVASDHVVCPSSVFYFPRILLTSQKSTIWHAKRICSISLNNTHQYVFFEASVF